MFVPFVVVVFVMVLVLVMMFVAVAFIVMFVCSVVIMSHNIAVLLFVF